MAMTDLRKIIPLMPGRQTASNPPPFTFSATSLRQAISRVPPKGPAELKDDKQTGLTLRRQTTGGSWTFTLYKKINGRVVRQAIAPYSDTVRVADVRERFDQLVADIRSGRHLEKKQEKAATVEAAGMGRMTFGEVLAEHVKLNRPRPSTAQMYGCAVAAFEAQLPKCIGDLTESKWRAAFLKLRDAGTYSPASLNSYAKVIRSLYETWRYLHPKASRPADNPVAEGMKVGASRSMWTAPTPRDGRLSAEERPRWLAAVREKAAKVHPNAAVTFHALEFIYLTGMRTGEVCGLTWAEVGEDALHIPASRMKAKRDFHRPLTPRLKELLAIRRTMATDGAIYVFPSWKSPEEKPLDDLRKALKAVNQTAGVDIVPHDLRRTFIATAEGNGIGGIPLKLLVAHSTGRDVTADYAGSLMEKLPELAANIEALLLEGVSNE